jgi:hypothetical protein
MKIFGKNHLNNKLWNFTKFQRDTLNKLATMEGFDSFIILDVSSNDTVEVINNAISEHNNRHRRPKSEYSALYSVNGNMTSMRIGTQEILYALNEEHERFIRNEQVDTVVAL